MKEMKRIKFHTVFQVLVFAVLIAIDQLTKALATSNLKDGADINVIKGILRFHYLENNGAAFGIFKNQMWLFFVLTIAVIAVLTGLFIIIIKKLKRYTNSKGEKVNKATVNSMIFLNYILAVLGAGAIGNFIDRILYKNVVDFIYVEFINFPVFNFADICVVLSAAALIIFFLFIYKEDKDFHIFSRNK